MIRNITIFILVMALAWCIGINLALSNINDSLESGITKECNETVALETCLKQLKDSEEDTKAIEEELAECEERPETETKVLYLEIEKPCEECPSCPIAPDCTKAEEAYYDCYYPYEELKKNYELNCLFKKQ